MPRQAPAFWWVKPGWQATLLAPVSFIYGAISGYRMQRAKRHISPLPVICVGNFTLGGAGKTPTALALALAARRRGLTPGFLSRGYGGSLQDATIVEPGRHTAAETGDEPLLLASAALTVVARRRIEGLHLLRQAGVDVVIMDDGFQSASFTPDYSLVVVDARRGIGNGCVFPAGPLRAPPGVQADAASALLVVGQGDAWSGPAQRMAELGKPVFHAAVLPLPGQDLAGQRVLAYAGIADPEKFYATLASLNATIAAKRSFGDHHPFSADEIAELLATAGRKNLVPVTTAKDIARLSGQAGKAAELVAASLVIAVGMVFENDSIPDELLGLTLENFRRRQ